MQFMMTLGVSGHMEVFSTLVHANNSLLMICLVSSMISQLIETAFRMFSRIW